MAWYMKKLLAVGFIILVICGVYWLTLKRSQQNHQQSQAKQNTFNKSAHSLNEPSSIWVIVNKHRTLPSTYAPANLRNPNMTLRLASGSPEMQLRDEAATAAESIATAAKKEGINLMLVSGYRSYSDQQAVYQSFVAQDGQAKADATSARPGHSEHQTGLAVDFGNGDRSCELEACFGETPAGKWLAAHAADYGFVLRYANGTQNVVGYEYEPWHFRYVGTDLAKEVNKSGKTLEEFFGLGAAPGYN